MELTQSQPQYSLVARDIEDEIRPFAQDRRIGAIVSSSMGSELLTGAMTRAQIARLPDDCRTHDARFTEPRLSRHRGPGERLRLVTSRHDATPGAVAADWTLRHPAELGAILGFRRPDQPDSVLGGETPELTDTDVAYLQGARRTESRR
jgi:aryl-alcohol dehydrogenase-like predicted oxidoreductase